MGLINAALILFGVQPASHAQLNMKKIFYHVSQMDTSNVITLQMKVLGNL